MPKKPEKQSLKHKKVKDFMFKDALTVGPEEKIISVMEDLNRHHIGAIIVTGPDEKPLGMITRKDIIRALVKHNEKAFGMEVSSVMSKPVLTVSSEDDLEFAFLVMSLNKVRRLPVIEKDRLTGIITHRDITNTWRKSYYFLQEEHESLKNSANTDWLTGVYNRKYISEELKNQVRIAKKFESAFSAVMIDIDNFKSVNDTYGHQAGDEVLRDMAMIIKQKTRDINITGRYGGGEFLILAPLSDSSSACHMAERLVDIVAGYAFRYNGRKMPLTISAGVSSWSDSHRTASDLLKDADAAMYASKKLGKNLVTCSEDLGYYCIDKNGFKNPASPQDSRA